MIDGKAEIGRGMTCHELVDLITEYTEQALDPAERAMFEAHLARCTGCQQHFHQIEATCKTLRRLGQVDVSPGTHAQLVGIYREWRQQAGPPEG